MAKLTVEVDSEKESDLFERILFALNPPSVVLRGPVHDYATGIAAQSQAENPPGTPVDESQNSTADQGDSDELLQQYNRLAEQARPSRRGRPRKNAEATPPGIAPAAAPEPPPVTVAAVPPQFSTAIPSGAVAAPYTGTVSVGNVPFVTAAPSVVQPDPVTSLSVTASAPVPSLPGMPVAPAAPIPVVPAPLPAAPPAPVPAPVPAVPAVQAAPLNPQTPAMPQSAAAPMFGEDGHPTIDAVRDAVRQANAAKPGVAIKIGGAHGWFTAEVVPVERRLDFITELSQAAAA